MAKNGVARNLSSCADDRYHRVFLLILTVLTMPTPAQQLAARKLYGGDGNVPSYLDQEVLTWSPEKITLKTYDLFIVSCKRNDVTRMNRVLIELMGALNFEYEESSTRLYRLYEYCQRCITQKKSDEALKIIQELRNTWAVAFNLE